VAHLEKFVDGPKMIEKAPERNLERRATDQHQLMISEKANETRLAFRNDGIFATYES